MRVEFSSMSSSSEPGSSISCKYLCIRWVVHENFVLMQFEQSIFRNSSFSKPSNPFVVPKCWPTGKKTSIQWLHEAWTQCNANPKGVIIINTMVFALCSMHNFILETRYETKRPFGPIFRKCVPDLNKLHEKKLFHVKRSAKKEKRNFLIVSLLFRAISTQNLSPDYWHTFDSSLAWSNRNVQQV